MGKQIAEVEVRFGRVHSNLSDDSMLLTLEDNVSGITFAEVEFSMEEFGNVISGRGTRVKAELRGLENIGKKYEHKRAKAVLANSEYIKLTSGLSYDEQKKALAEWLKLTQREDDWHVNPYLGSRGSIESDYKSNTVTLNFGLFRYVDVPA